MYSEAIFEMPVVGGKVNDVLGRDFDKMTPEFKCRQCS